jgi:hypothetical protein
MGGCSRGAPLALMYVLGKNKITLGKQGDTYVYLKYYLYNRTNHQNHFQLLVRHEGVNFF